MNTRPLIAIATLVLPALAAAQSTCKPSADKNEAKLLAYFAGPLAFSSVPGVAGLTRGQVALAGELALLPSPPSSITRSSGVCGFNKSENTDLAPVFPRPRVALGLGGGFVAEFSYLPPVTVMDAKPHMGGVAFSWTPRVQLPVANAAIVIRAHATFGGVDGPITCPESELQTTNAAQPCYGTTPSEDTYEPNVRGLEGVFYRKGGRLTWHAGGGVNSTASRLLVNFTDSRGFVDNNIVEITLTRVALLGGLSFDPTETLALSAQVYSVPSDATTARLGIAWRVR
jgi:hypothetical protein